jgi:hypothetical protein
VQTKPAAGTRVRLTVDPLAVPAIANALAGFGPIPPHDLRRDAYIVKDTMDRKTYNKPDRVGIGPEDLGIAFGIALSDIEPVP